MYYSFVHSVIEMQSPSSHLRPHIQFGADVVQRFLLFGRRHPELSESTAFFKLRDLCGFIAYKTDERNGCKIYASNVSKLAEVAQ